MNGSGLSFCSIDEAWGSQQKVKSPEELYNIKTPKSKNTPNKNKAELDRYYENHNGILKRSSDANGVHQPSGVSNQGGMKPMSYGKREDTGEGSINPFFRQMVEKYKKENENLKLQIEQLRKELLIYKNSDAQSVSSVNTNMSSPGPKKTNLKPTKQKLVKKENKQVNMAHIPFDIEPEAFNVFIFAFVSIVFLLFIDKGLTDRGLRIF